MGETIMGNIPSCNGKLPPFCKSPYGGIVPTMQQLVQNLTRLMKEKDFNQKSLALAAGLNETAVRDILKGKSLNPRLDTLQRLAAALRCHIWDITGDAPSGLIKVAGGRQIEIRGFVQAGLWAESHELPPDEWLVIDSHGAYEQYRSVTGLMVRGDSMDKIFPPSTFLIVCPIIDFGREPDSGNFVVVCRRCADGLTEWTVKEFREIAGEKWLRPHSRNPRYQNIRLPNRGGDGVVMMDDDRQIEEVRIWGIVVGYHNPNIPRAND